MNCSQWLAEKFQDEEFKNVYSEMNEMLDYPKLLRVYEKNFRPLVKALLFYKRQLNKTEAKLKLAYGHLPERIVERIEKSGGDIK